MLAGWICCGAVVKMARLIGDRVMVCPGKCQLRVAYFII